MNKAILIGRVGRDPEMKSFDWGKVVEFPLATTIKYKKDGEKKEMTDWHRCKATNKTADLIGSYVNKGDLIGVEGQIRYREFEKDGVKKYITEIHVSSIEFFPKEAKSTKTEQPTAEPKKEQPPLEPEANEDDLPF